MASSRLLAPDVQIVIDELEEIEKTLSAKAKVSSRDPTELKERLANSIQNKIEKIKHLSSKSARLINEALGECALDGHQKESLSSIVDGKTNFDADGADASG